MIVVWIFAFFIVSSMIEARLEVPVIAMKDPTLPDYAKLNRDEHRWSGVWYAHLVFGMCGLSALVCGPTWYTGLMALALIVVRRVFFEFFLKILRKRSIKKIEGNQFWDITSRKVFGANGGYIELAVYIPVIAVSCWVLSDKIKVLL